jgi:transposase-like protein
MDGLPGLEEVFREEFPQGKVQRCQVHVARNVLAKVPQKLKQKVADDIRSIFYASSRGQMTTRFTPTYMGNTTKFNWLTFWVTVHPHIHGEYC